MGSCAGDEVGATRRAARLRVVVGEEHPFLGQLVEIRRPSSHQAAVVGADVPPADVVTHDDDDVGLFSCAWAVGVPTRATTQGHQQCGYHTILRNVFTPLDYTYSHFPLCFLSSCPDSAWARNMTASLGNTAVPGGARD